MLTSRRGAFYILAAGLATMAVFAAIIRSGFFLPFKLRVDNGFSAGSANTEVVSLLIFAVSSSVILIFIVTLLENLNGAWQKETQALNLLQQERDLLEQRVEERTHDLVEVRDQAVTVSRQMRKYYRAIEQSGNTIVITDTKGNIEYVNPKFEQSTGYTIEEALGNNPRILKSGRHSDEEYSQLWKTISGGNAWNGEFLNKRKDGSLYWESATIAPVLDQNDVITNYVAIKRRYYRAPSNRRTIAKIVAGSGTKRQHSNYYG